MHRLRFLAAAFLVLFLLGVAPAIAQQDTADENAPAVVIEDAPEAFEEEAWTFRYLVPTLIGVTGIVIIGVALGYALRVGSRYRVTQ